MPLYDYGCTKCGYAQEMLLPAPKPTINCPRCGKTMLKVFSAPSSLRMDGKRTFRSRHYPKHFDPVTGKEFTKAEVDFYTKEV